MRHHRLTLWLNRVSLLVLLAVVGYGSDLQGEVTEEFHQVYQISADGRVALENINGPVHITGWGRNEVKVDAIKRASDKERLDEAKIEVDSSANSISIRTSYPGYDRASGNDNWYNPRASVEYTVTVPQRARLDEIKLINGRLDIQDVAGDVEASCVNGRLEARNLHGTTRLKTVNGELVASVDRMPASELQLSAVNGTMRVTLPSDAKADIEANTVSGHISNDFGLPVSNHRMVGHSLRGELGGGGTRVNLSNVNGAIEIHHAHDNRPLSPAKNLDRGDRDRDNDDEI
jgi:DUF4097 and DUF4098 domain-containing protein YvlB